MPKYFLPFTLVAALLFHSPLHAQPVAPPHIVQAIGSLDADYRRNGIVGLKVGWNKCIEQASATRVPRTAERCLVYVYGAYIIDRAVLKGLKDPTGSSPGMEWDNIYPSLLRMFDIMQVPVASRQTYLSQYEGWIVTALSKR